MDFLWSHEFQRRYQKLPVKVQEKFKERLTCFIADQVDPVLNNHKLTGQYLLHRSINVTGDYRAVYREVDVQTIKWVTIGTHSQLYE